ncbi:MAG TPA: hypothetical protein VFD18_01965, partial [Chthoniobacterales bacterium]|nr:hypothetical protein [Chthoniobacterales bacterium]
LRLHTIEGTMYLLQIFASGFLAILFLQSGIDKVVDRRGNLEWLQGHFAKSPLAGMVPLLVTTITILEIAAGGLSAVGCILIILTRDSTLAFYGAAFATISIIALFFGQRMAKDYAGAATLVPYFLLTLISLYILAVR